MRIVAIAAFLTAAQAQYESSLFPRGLSAKNEDYCGLELDISRFVCPAIKDEVNENRKCKCGISVTTRCRIVGTFMCEPGDWDLDLGDAGDIGIDIALRGRGGSVGITTTQNIELPKVSEIPELKQLVSDGFVSQEFVDDLVESLNIPTELPVSVSFGATVQTPRDLLNSAEVSEYKITTCSLEIDYDLGDMDEYLVGKINGIVNKTCACDLIGKQFPSPSANITCGQFKFAVSSDGIDLPNELPEIDFSDFPLPTLEDLFDIPPIGPDGKFSIPPAIAEDLPPIPPTFFDPPSIPSALPPALAPALAPAIDNIPPAIYSDTLAPAFLDYLPDDFPDNNPDN